MRVQAEREPTDIEEEVARALFELQEQERDADPQMRRYLRELQFYSAREVEVTANKKAIIIMVPHRLLATFHKLQVRLVRELEKKFSGKFPVIIAQRKIMQNPRKMAVRTPSLLACSRLSGVHARIK